MLRIRSVAVAAALSALGLVAPAAAQTVTVTPWSSVITRSDHKVFVTITWCDTYHYYGTKTITLDGADITNQFVTRWDNIGCGHPNEMQADQFYFTDTATIYVDPSGGFAHTLTGLAVDGSNDQLYFSISYVLPDPRRNVVVASDPQFRNVAPSTSGLTQRFAVLNVGNATDTVSLSKSCTGFASSCTLSPSSLVVGVAATQYATVTFSSSATTNDTATIKLIATTATPAYTDSSWALETVKPNASGGVAIVGTSPGVNNYVARDLCVTIAVAENAGSECGDLRIVHALPTIQTLGRARTPTLLYNSQHARPKPLIQADVTLPTSWNTLPDSVQGCILISGSSRGCKWWPGSQWGALGVTRRVAVPGDDGTWSTGLYAYTLQVASSGGQSALTATGELPVVNRQGSGLGAGWWLAGLEQIYSVSSSRLMVVGGDGTVRVYSSVGTNTYTSNNPTRPDTLTGSGTTFVRHAPNGVEIHFASGQHVYTRSAMGDTTWFDYSSGVLTSIRVPTRTGYATYSLTGIVLDLQGSNGYFQTLTSPSSRSTTMWTSSLTGGFRVDSVQDPDGYRMRFYSSSGSNQFRVDSLKNRRLKVTKFDYDNGVRLSRAVRPLSIIDSLLVAETRGLSAAQPLDSVFTQLNGPRTDVADITRFWVNGFGAPTRIRDAFGHETRITYDGTWAGLASEVITPSRLRSTAHYTSRGLPDTVRAFNPLGDGQTATTAYQFDPVWNHPTRITSPTGLVSSDSLRTDYPAPVWEQSGSSAARRVSYTYDSHRQLSKVSPPIVPAETLSYDTLGNVVWSRTSGGAVTTYTRDALGRVTRGVSPYGDTSRTWYSVMDRIDSTLGKGNGMTAQGSGRSHPADTVRVSNTYDADGDLTGTTRKVRLGGTIQYLTTGWTYDDADRVVAESRPGGGSFNYSLDAAGNRTSTNEPNGFNVTATFDALNRPTSRMLPSVDYTTDYCMLSGYCLYTFPTRDGSDHCIGVDTAYFDYDAAGNLRRADNGWALVRRGYAPGGLMTDDTLVIRTYETNGALPCGGGDRHAGSASHYINDFSHTYTLQITYDLDGRRTRLYHPDGIDFCFSGRCSQKYVYSDTTGELTRLVVEKPSDTPDTALFTYDALGRLTITRHLSGVSDTASYDNDSHVSARSGPFGAAFSLNRDALGRLTSGTSGDTSASFQYGPLGALVYSANMTQGTGFEEFDTDALGNRTWQRDDGSRSNFPGWDDRQKTLYINTSLQLDSIRWSGSGVPYGLTGPNGLSYWAVYDAAGNVRHTAAWEPYYSGGEWAVQLDEAVSFYDAEGRLQGTNRGVGLSALNAGSSYEEYRYDALGRRVLVRSRCTANATDPMCRGYIERTVYDGDQVLYEIRAPGQDSVSSTYTEYDGYGGGSQYDYMLGSVGYVHAGGIDQPLGVYRMSMPGQSSVVGVTPHPNFLGEFSIGSWITGQNRGQRSTACTQNTTDCPIITWPGGNITADGMLTGGASYTTWFGNLLSRKTDGSGLHFMRNRYYDPQTGRFTQQDPIGLAGGLNSYGFAGGDPINFNDPFGLYADCDPPGSCVAQRVQQGFVVGTTGGLAVAAACTVTTAGACALGPAEAVLAAGTTAGILAGLAVGAGEEIASAISISGIGRGLRKLGGAILVGWATLVNPPNTPSTDAPDGVAAPRTPPAAVEPAAPRRPPAESTAARPKEREKQ